MKEIKYSFIVMHEPKFGKSKLLKMWSAKYSRDQDFRYRQIKKYMENLKLYRTVRG